MDNISNIVVFVYRNVIGRVAKGGSVIFEGSFFRGHLKNLKFQWRYLLFCIFHGLRAIPTKI